MLRVLTGRLSQQGAALTMRPRLDQRLWWAWPLLSFAALCAIVFTHYSETLFYRYDGTFVLTLVRSQAKWMAPGPGFSLNYLQGMGDIWIPTATSWIPGLLLGSFFNDEWLPVVAWFIFALEYFLSSVALARCMDGDRVVAVAGAWLGALLVMPFFIPPVCDWVLWGNPHFITAIAVTSISLCAFLQIGRGKVPALWRDAGIVLLLVLLESYLFLSQPVRAVIAAPMLAFFGLAAAIGAECWRERLCKLIAGTVLSAILAVCFAGYIYALFYYARTTFFWDDLAALPVHWKQQSFIMSEAPSYGVVIWLACLLGAALAAVRERGRLRMAAVSFLVFVGLQQSIVLAASIGGFLWSGPTIAYIDLFSLPLYGIFGAYLAVGWWGRGIKKRLQTSVALALLPWAVLLTLGRPNENVAFRTHYNPFPWPPRETSITQKLAAEIGLREGDIFRGRVANLAGGEFMPQYDRIPFISQHAYDSTLSFFSGNDHRNYGLWYYDIPTLSEDNQFSSPFLHVVSSRLFNRPDQKHVRQFITLTRFVPRALALLGVHFVIVSRPLADLQPIATMTAHPDHPEGWTLFLYELRDAKTTGYWSTRPLSVSSVRQAMLWMTSGLPNEADAAVYEALEVPLVTGSFSELRVFRDRLVVSAESAGTSLLVLPLEFSHCLDLRVTSDAPVRLLRANINQAALLFSGRAISELRYRYSPWHFGCRLRDIEDARSLQLSNVGWPD
jgi:hypothetical protein